MKAFAQGALRKFTQWLWIEHPTFQLGGGHFTTELMPSSSVSLRSYFVMKKKTWWVAPHTVAAFAFQICNCRYTRKKSSAGTDKKRRYRRSDDKAEPWCTWKIGNMPGPTKLRRYITEVITGEFYCAKWLFISSLCGNCGKFDAYYKKNPILSLSPGILVKPWSKLSHLQLDWRLTNRWKPRLPGDWWALAFLAKIEVSDLF